MWRDVEDVVPYDASIVGWGLLPPNKNPLGKW